MFKSIEVTTVPAAKIAEPGAHPKSPRTTPPVDEDDHVGTTIAPVDELATDDEEGVVSRDDEKEGTRLDDVMEFVDEEDGAILEDGVALDNEEEERMRLDEGKALDDETVGMLLEETDGVALDDEEVAMLTAGQFLSQR